MIPESFKQDLLNRVDIVDVINSRVPLKKGGANWMACCPFHSEKSPSFTVSPSKQFYHCFGCGAHGNAIGFLMEYAGLGYVDAMRELAESVGMKLPEFEPAERTRHLQQGADLYDYMQRAARYYREQLKQAPRAIDYLKKRGLTGQIAARFGIGYAPDGWQNLENAFAQYGDRALVDCGLVIENDSGKRYDRFRDRIMFPILNQRGSVIGFGGRVIDAGEPKYLNSPETPLFEKGRELYGLTQARQAIRTANRVVVVEGYMDVVALAQHGVENVVATLGTATSVTHVQKLLKQADEVVFCFDGDAAGRRAAWHALEVSLEALSDRKAVKFLFLPAEHDPDSYVRTLGHAAFDTALAGAQALSAFLLAQLKTHGDMATLEGRARVVADAKPLLKRVAAAPVLQSQLVKALAEEVGMAPQEVGRLADIRMSATPYALRPNRSQPRPANDVRLERELLRCLLIRPELVERVDIEVIDSASETGRCIAALVERLSRAEAASSAVLLEAVRDTEYAPLVESLQAELLSNPIDDVSTLFDHTVARLHERRNDLRFEELNLKVKTKSASTEEKYEYVRLATLKSSALASGPEDPM